MDWQVQQLYLKMDKKYLQKVEQNSNDIDVWSKDDRCYSFRITPYRLCFWWEARLFNE